MKLSYKWMAAIVCAIGLFMAVLDNTIVNVALPQMQTDYHTTYNTIVWVITGYFLAQAAVIPVAGYLADLIGTKIVFISALLLFTMGSGLCALAPSEHWLIAFRLLQGLGGGVLFPIAFAIVFRVFPPAERGPAGAVIGVPVLLAPAFGPTIGGYLTTTFDWRAIFTVNLPVGVVAIVLAYFVLHGRAEERAQHETASPSLKRFDFLGLLLSMAGFTALVYGITEAATATNGWHDVTVDRFLIAGAVLLVAFVINELRVSDPVMDLRLFANYTFSMANVMMWAVSGLLFGSLVLIPIFFEEVQGNSALTTGEILISQGIAAAVATVISGRLYNSVGPRILAVIGFILLTGGTFGFTNLSLGTTGASLQGWLILRGLGLGFVNIPMQTLAASVVSNRAMARASSLMNVTRQVFGAIGVSALTTYMAQQALSHADTIKSALLTAQATHTMPGGTAGACVRAAGNVPAQIVTCVQQHAEVAGINNTFWVTMIGCAICVVLAALVGRDPAVEAHKQAVARGEKLDVQRPAIMAE